MSKQIYIYVFVVRYNLVSGWKPKLLQSTNNLTLGREYKIAMEKCKIKFPTTPNKTEHAIGPVLLSTRQPDNTHHVKYLHSLQE